MRSPNSGATPRGRSETGGGNNGEFEAIGRLRRRLPGPPAGEVWIGDDAAVLGPGDGRLLLTTDLSVAGVHADLGLIGLDDLGWRALAAAVSDVAAMGGRPDGAVVGVAGPPTTDLDLLYDGIAASSEAHGCPVVGGDLSNSSQLVVAVAVTGHVPGAPGPSFAAVPGPATTSSSPVRSVPGRRGSGCCGAERAEARGRAPGLNPGPVRARWRRSW